MGLTFLAWANSVGDLVADISLAKVGKAKTAVAACFGTPLLNLLVGLGLGCLIAILTVPGREDGVALFVSPVDSNCLNIYFFQMDQQNMSLAGGDVIILLVLLFYLPLGMVKLFDSE